MNIVLRKWRIEDADALSFLANNRKIADKLRDRFPHPYTRQDAVQWIGLQEAREPVTDFAVEAEGKLSGGCGLILQQDIYRCSAEIGYWVGEPYWGKGIATAAVQKLVTYISLTFPSVIRIYAEVFVNNNPSKRVLGKNGFSLESTRKKAVIKNNILLDDEVWVCLLHK